MEKNTSNRLAIYQNPRAKGRIEKSEKLAAIPKDDPIKALSLALQKRIAEPKNNLNRQSS